jgi:hypothetical protein
VTKVCRVVAIVTLLGATLCATGCLHTWTQTYQDYPPSAWDPAHSRTQGNPGDG